jgi:hypothetical protein
MTESLRDTLIELMPAPLETKLHDVEKQLESMRTGHITAYYNLGKILKLVQDDPDRYRGTDGSRGIDLLLKATGKHESTLKLALRFVDQYAADDLAALLELENKRTGFKLAWSHIPILLTLDTKASRKKYASKAVREELSAKELHALLKLEEGREGGSTGRPFVIPPTVSKQLTAMQKDLISIRKKQDQVWNGDGHSTFAQIIGTNSEELDDDWLEQLLEVRSGFADMADLFANNITSADECITLIRSVLESREADATAAAASTTAAVASTGRRSRAVVLDDDDTAAPEPVAPVRRSGGRRTAVAEV